METGKFEKKYYVGVLVCAILSLLGIISSIICIPLYGGFIFVELAIFVFLIYYVSIGYKTPHGNTFKYMLWVFAITRALSVLIKSGGFNVTPICILLAALIIAYMSGRLDRFKQNKILGWIVLGLLLLAGIVFSIEVGRNVGNSLLTHYFMCVPAILWLDMFFAYYIRYQMHREAGFAEKKQK